MRTEDLELKVSDWLWDDEQELPTTPRTRRPKPVGKALFESAVRFIERSSNRKLSPVEVIPQASGARPAITPRPPFCCSTYTSIAATCVDTCPFKAAGCYAATGYTALINGRMDATARAEQLDALAVIKLEATAIDKAFGGARVPQDGARGGRDLRLHVGGDIGGAPTAGEAAALPAARSLGYAPAIVVPRFPDGPRAWALADGKAVPCPAETRRTTCAECRLCLDRDLHGLNVTIAFTAHGVDDGRAARRALHVLNGTRPAEQMELTK
jgi:hypothetical protein